MKIDQLNRYEETGERIWEYISPVFFVIVASLASMFIVYEFNSMATNMKTIDASAYAIAMIVLNLGLVTPLAYIYGKKLKWYQIVSIAVWLLASGLIYLFVSSEAISNLAGYLNHGSMYMVQLCRRSFPDDIKAELGTFASVPGVVIYTALMTVYFWLISKLGSRLKKEEENPYTDYYTD